MRQPGGSVWAERALVALFLASLAGTLNLVVMIHRDAARNARERARIEAERVAQTAKAAPIVTPPAASPPPAVAAKPRPEDRPTVRPPSPAPAPLPEDPTKVKLAALASATAREMAAAKEADRKAEAAEQARARALAESDRWKRREMLVTQQVSTIADRVKKIDQQVDDLAFERDVLARERDALKAAVAKQSGKGSYAVLPYKGPNGSWRRPIVLECVNGTVAVRPNGPVFSMLDLASMGTPRSSPVILAIARELLRVQGSDSPDGAPVVPYFVFLVRPDGIRPYYEIRARLEPLGMAFGYELVDQDLKVDVPDFDDLRTWDGTIPLDEPIVSAPDGKDRKGSGKGSGSAGNGLAQADAGGRSASAGEDGGLNWPDGGAGAGREGIAGRGGKAGAAEDDSPEAFVWPRPGGRGSRPSAGSNPTDANENDGGGLGLGEGPGPGSGAGAGLPGPRPKVGGGGKGGGTGTKGTGKGSEDGSRPGLGGAVKEWTAASRGSSSKGRIDPRLGGGTGTGSEEDLRAKGWKVVPDLEAADESGAASGGTAAPGVAPPSGSSPIPAPEPLVLDGPTGGTGAGSLAGRGRGRTTGEAIAGSPTAGSSAAGEEPGGLEWQAGSGKPPAASGSAGAAGAAGALANQGQPAAGNGGAAELARALAAASAKAKGPGGSAGPTSAPSGLGVSLGSLTGSGSPSPSSPSSTSGAAAPSIGGLVFGSDSGQQGSPASSPGDAKGDGSPEFMPPIKSRIPDGPSKTIEVPFEITVACEPTGLLIHPGGYRITASSLRDRKKDSLLVRQLLAVANQRAAADPTIRPLPRVKFLVEGGGSETFWSARKQILFSGLGWPMSLQVTGDQGPRLMEPQAW
ncbi:hypothetical protein [Aquisphaera insulae]|uniref:hypothetical protein n=1 Tax=Aquisphaera insulae TaxID=2712864 RepID=UPI0013EA7BAE|nr:hypothetical protein [Aquisphaera insulae]